MAKIIIEIDEELKHKILMKAVFEKLTIKSIVTSLLTQWVKKETRKDKK